MRKRVLLLEDNKEIRELIEDILTGEGYQVIALNRYESVADIIDFAPHLILLDIKGRHKMVTGICSAGT